ncbi:glutamine-hydrolyzing carbamoyl-phosphate synthase small subunit [Nanoarchaeota archaeon]
MNKCKLVLEDGTVFQGESFGAKHSVAGEVVFTTGMVGYPESMTDPSYCSQILVFTYPLIGNYGVPEDEIIKQLSMHLESTKIQCSGIVVANYSEQYSHWDADKSLAAWMKEHNIPGITGIDTRALTQKLRSKGVMLGKIVVDKDVDFYDPNKENLAAKVSVDKAVTYGKGKRVVAIDCGMKHNIVRSFVERGVQVIRVPWDYDIHKLNFDGLFISNGPGDPKMCKETIENIRIALEKGIPTFGICLGNQLLALAAGADTYKLKYGHRGQNQPCLEVGTKKCIITSQNHGFAVKKTLPKGWKPWFINANDGTNEGIRHVSKPFFSVQFHPEASPGPTDASYLFDKFIGVLDG